MTERPDVEELARLLAEALPGEWLQGPPHVVRIEDRDEQGRKRTRFVAEMYATRGLPDTRAAHAALIAAAVNALPALLARIATLEAELGASRNEAQGQYDLNVELIAKMAAAEADLAAARQRAEERKAWIDAAVAGCAARGCAQRDRWLAEAIAAKDAAEAEVARLRDGLSNLRILSEPARDDYDETVLVIIDAALKEPPC
jgi:7,8-dihydro-6-hydroxymethylpterin-pyrophosphokinase